MADDIDFDGEDLINATLGNEHITEQHQPPRPQIGQNLGWILAWLLTITVLVAVGIAVNQSPSAASPSSSMCGGLVEPSCCDDSGTAVGACPPTAYPVLDSCVELPDESNVGLFDAEDHLVRYPDVLRC